MTGVLVALYAGFVGLVAFAPQLMARPVIGVISLGLVLGFVEIVLAVVLTGAYVWSANAHDAARDPGSAP